MKQRAIRNVAIIGSGLAGLTLAIRLKEAGIPCTVFEKARGPGGRMSSKRLGVAGVDLGAQFFTIRNPKFREFLGRYVSRENFGLWQGQFRHEDQKAELMPSRSSERFVGIPRMSTIPRRLSHHLSGYQAKLYCLTGVARIEHEHDTWTLYGSNGQPQGTFGALVVTTPPEQAAELTHAYPEVRTDLLGYKMLPCWAVACTYGKSLELEFSGVSCRHTILGWAGCDTSKPQRSRTHERWVLHAQPDWSEAHRNDDPESIGQALTRAFGEHFNRKTNPIDRIAHRWLYARPGNISGPGHLSYDTLGLGFCGDWLNGGRVEGAFESAESLFAHWVNKGILPSGKTL